VVDRRRLAFAGVTHDTESHPPSPPPARHKENRNVKRRIFVLFATLAALLGLSVGHAGHAEAGAATDVVKAKQAALFELVKLPSNPANQKKIGALFDEMLDYSALAEASLGAEWAARTPEERAEFSGILKQLVTKNYEKNLKKTAAFRIDYVGEQPAADGTLVKTKAFGSDPREEPVEIDFKMLEKAGKWRVQDIVTEGVSLVSSYRNQFTKIVKKDGFPALIKKMREKLAKGDV
jgi:phospholipid transport system substrate-binding protein